MVIRSIRVLNIPLAVECMEFCVRFEAIVDGMVQAERRRSGKDGAGRIESSSGLVQGLYNRWLDMKPGLTYVLMMLKLIELIVFIMDISLCHGYHIERSYPIGWSIGEPMPVFFYRILQYY